MHDNTARILRSNGCMYVSRLTFNTIDRMRGPFLMCTRFVNRG